jgi:hypothetical protein
MGSGIDLSTYGTEEDITAAIKEGATIGCIACTCTLKKRQSKISHRKRKIPWYRRTVGQLFFN